MTVVGSRGAIPTDRPVPVPCSLGHLCRLHRRAQERDSTGSNSARLLALVEQRRGPIAEPGLLNVV